MIMLLGAFASGARVASIVAAASALSAIALHDWPSTSPQARFRMKAILLLAAALAIPAALIVLASLGLFERFQNGLIDESALARVNIYRLFELVSWKEILFGTDIGNIRRLALYHFDLEFIESSLVMFVFQFGLLARSFFCYFWRARSWCCFQALAATSSSGPQRFSPLPSATILCRRKRQTYDHASDRRLSRRMGR
jgi:hypothetical protein